MARPSPRAKAKEREKPLQYVSEHTERGGLHRSLGIPEGEKIGAKRIAEATHSKNPRTRKEANLAQTYARARRGG